MRLHLPAIVLLVGVSSCGFLKSLVGANSIDLSKAEVKSMSVDIRRKEKTICPREPVQMAVFADVVLEGAKEAKPFETWTGRGSVNKNDKLEFTDFAFHAKNGAFDEDGWFSPSTELLLTADEEFEITTAYKRRPDKFTFKMKYKPDYVCIKAGGSNGASGTSGQSGSSGPAGSEGSSGSDKSAGGNGRDGGTGTPGGNGSDGARGPEITAYATLVKTAFYEKLIAVELTGTVQDVLLFPVEQTLSLHALGGAGGPGGSGGAGGPGGRGGSGNPGGNGGNGGPGGNGGNGGVGGAGGKIELTFDSRFPEIAKQIVIDVSGGPAGGAGSGGLPGSSGSGGTGLGQNGKMGSSGSSGSSGSQGASGQAGPNGIAKTSPGQVTDRFSKMKGLTVL
jgi:hypothetical protein